MEDYEEDVTPFWLQTTNTGALESCRSLFFNTGVLIILLLAVAFAFIFIVIRSFLSFTSKVFKPQVVKKAWDSLNLVLVLFAVICAFLNKRNGDDETPRSNGDYEFSSTAKHVVVHDDDDRVRRSNPSSSGQRYYDRTSSADNGRERSRRLFFNTGVLMILLLVIAFALIFIVIPSFLSFPSNIFKNQVVKKTWDSLNLVIVLFAGICAILNKRNGNDETSRSCRDYKFSSTSKHVVVVVDDDDDDDPVQRSNPLSSGQRYYDRTSSADPTAYVAFRRMRSSSLYSDRRRQSTLVMNSDDQSRREFDEEQVYFRHPSPSPPTYQAPVPTPVATTIEPSAPPAPELKNNHSFPSSPSPVAPLPPAPPPSYQVSVLPHVSTTIEPSAPPAPELSPLQPFQVVRRKPKWTCEDVPRRERNEREEVYRELKNKHSLPSPPSSVAPPPPPPPPPPYQAPVRPPVARTIETSTPSALELPPFQPPQVVRRKPNWTYEDVPHRERSEYEEAVYSELKNKHSLPLLQSSAAPPHPPPPPPHQEPVPPPVATTIEPSAPPAPELSPSQPSKVVRRKPKWTYEYVPLRERSEREEVVYSELKNKHSLPSPSSVTPPPPPYQATVPSPVATKIETTTPSAPELPWFQPPQVVRRKHDWTYEDVPHRERNEHEEIVYSELKNKHFLPSLQPSAAPPLPPPNQASVPPTVATTIEPSAPPAPELPLSQPLKVARIKLKWTYKDVPPRERSEHEEIVYSELENKHSFSSPPLPPPSQPASSQPIVEPERRSNKSEKKRDGVATEF